MRFGPPERLRLEVTIDGMEATVEGHRSPGCKGARDRELINGRFVTGRPIEPDDPPTFSVHQIYRKGGKADFLLKKLEDDRIRESVELQIGEEIGGEYMIEY